MLQWQRLLLQLFVDEDNDVSKHETVGAKTATTLHVVLPINGSNDPLKIVWNHMALLPSDGPIE
jgi:hypothetical protein